MTSARSAGALSDTGEVPNVWLCMPNRVENVAVAEEAVLGLAEFLGLDALAAEDLRTSTSEASKNVVFHAYEGAEGPLELQLHTFAGAVEVVVRDHGIGIRPHVGERTLPHNGIGLPIVHALCESVLYRNLPDGGTEVHMRIPLPDLAPLATPAEHAPACDLRGTTDAAQTIQLAIAPVALAVTILPRVAGALAPRGPAAARWASEARGLADTAATGTAGDSPAGWVGVVAERVGGGLELRVAGPGTGEPLALRLGEPG